MPEGPARRDRSTLQPRRRSSRGHTITELVVAFLLATILIGLVYAVFTPSHRQGGEMETQATTTHALLVLHSTMERDTQAAEQIAQDGGALVLTRVVGRDLNREDYGLEEVVRYTHTPGDRIVRTVEERPRVGSNRSPSSSRSYISHQSFVRATFQRRKDEPLIDVTLETPSPRDRVRGETFLFTLECPLIWRKEPWVATGL